MNFSADRIDDRGVWLGDIDASENFAALDHHRIKYLVTILDYQPTCRDPHRTYLTIFADDFPSTDLLTNEFEKCFTFIDRVIEQGEQVLVHCHAGLSRSATIVTMYLMRKYSLTRDQALEQLKSKRIQSTISINEGFLHQLDLFHQMNYRIDLKNEHLIEFQQNRLKRIEKKSSDETKSHFGLEKIHREYRCRQCQMKLFTNEDVQHHQTRFNTICHDRETIWTFYLDWIEEIFHQSIDSLKCPNCENILGNYSLQGIRCSCDQWIKPAFLFECRSIE